MDNPDTDSLDEVTRLLTDFSDGKLSPRGECSLSDLENLRTHYLTRYASDERVYKVFSACYMEHKLWKKALYDMYSRLYLLDKDSKDCRDTFSLMKSAEDNLLEEQIQLPIEYKERLFSRDLTYIWKSWVSKMYHTESLQSVGMYASDYNQESNTIVTRKELLPGDLLHRSKPFVVSPWKISLPEYSMQDFVDENSSVKNSSSCFHCLGVISHYVDLSFGNNKSIACPVKSHECIHSFCSEDCFLNNGVIHLAECGILAKLKSFSEKWLNETLVLLVVRFLIRCRLCNKKEGSGIVDTGCSSMEGKSDNETLVHHILNIDIDYSILNAKHHKTLEEIRIFAYFLLESIGMEFCLHLTVRELVHLVVVLWVKSVPVIPEVYTEFEGSKDNLGGIIFSFGILKFQQSRNSNCALHFDIQGRVTIRSIYNMGAGTKLYINTVMDKYLPDFLQNESFWSVSSLLSHNSYLMNLQCDQYMNQICGIRCNSCIKSFCYITGFSSVPKEESSTSIVFCSESQKKNLKDGDNDLGNLTKFGKVGRRYVWSCEGCGSSTNMDDLNLLQNKAENIIRRAHSLYSAGKYLMVKSLLKNFADRWSGVLHPNHYILYNAHLLLAGILMNRAGSNHLMALCHLKKALLMAEEMLPIACQEKGHLYSRLADLTFKILTTDRISRKSNEKMKHLAIEASHSALWNWTIIAGSNSREALLHMQKCRTLAFELNVHTPFLTRKFTINIPNKYIDAFKTVTGNRAISPVLNKLITCSNLENADCSDFKVGNGAFKQHTLRNFYDVTTIAFMAAQSGSITDPILDLLASVESYGILQLGTGLSILGIVASNCNVELVEALIKSIERRVRQDLDFISLAEEFNDDVASCENVVMNLLLSSLVGGNEFGITPLMAMASFPLSSLHKSNLDNLNSEKCKQETYLRIKNETIIARMIIESIERCDEILEMYRHKLDGKPLSKNFMAFMKSGIKLKSLTLDSRTHHFLNGQTVLHYAASTGKNSLVQYLAMVGGNVNRMNLECATPLHLAALNGHFDVVKSLLSFGAKANIPLITGELPLHLAIYGLHKAIVGTLLEFYTREDIKDLDRRLTGRTISKVEEKGPSIWHALVAGIYRTDFDHGFLMRCEKATTLDLKTMINRLTKAVEIAQLLIEFSTANEVFGVYVWSNTKPSQILRDNWRFYMENTNKLISNGQNMPELLSGAPRIQTNTNVDNISSIYAAFVSKRVEDYTHEELTPINDHTDVAFAATRAMQFLTQVLERVEGSVTCFI